MVNPTGQQAFDNSTNLDGQFDLDELGLRAFSTEGANRVDY